MDGRQGQALRKHQSLLGKLLLSTALVAVSLAYGWWQRQNAAAPNMTMAPTPANRVASTRLGPAVAPPQTSMAPATPAAEDANTPARDTSSKTPTPKPAIDPAAQRTRTPAALAAPVAAQSGQDTGPPPLTAMAALRMYQPPPPQIPLPLVTGTPAPGAAAPTPAGTHLQDGDYLSDRQQYEWGDLQVKILIHGGQIIGAQLVQYPDHRAESLQLSQMASPILNREVIQTQQSKVDVVSSATDTSYVYQDAIANAIFKATRQ